MKRNLKITIDSTSNNENSVYINNIDSIINYSCDSIEIDCLEFLQESVHSTVVKLLLEKLRQKGRLIISISNPKVVAENFLNDSVSYQKFLEFFKNRQSLVSPEILYTMIDFNSFDIAHLDIVEYITTIVFERK